MVLRVTAQAGPSTVSGAATRIDHGLGTLAAQHIEDYHAQFTTLFKQYQTAMEPLQQSWIGQAATDWAQHHTHYETVATQVRGAVQDMHGRVAESMQTYRTTDLAGI